MPVYINLFHKQLALRSLKHYTTERSCKLIANKIQSKIFQIACIALHFSLSGSFYHSQQIDVM